MDALERENALGWSREPNSKKWPGKNDEGLKVRLLGLHALVRPCATKKTANQDCP